MRGWLRRAIVFEDLAKKVFTTRSVVDATSDRKYSNLAPNKFLIRFPAMSQLLTRRRLLGSTAALAAAALMPPNLRRVLAQPQPTQGSLRDIKHVVMLMQENCSFDHYFGTLSGVRGFSDEQGYSLHGVYWH